VSDSESKRCLHNISESDTTNRQRGVLRNNSESDTANREVFSRNISYSDTVNREVSSKTSLNQTQQIERYVLKNISE
jgi:hypothetical protein